MMGKEAWRAAFITVMAIWASQSIAGVLPNTLYRSDAQQVYIGLECPMWEVDVGIFEEGGILMYFTIFDSRFESNDSNLFHILGSLAAVGAVSRITDWHSDLVVIGFTNHALVYTSEQSRELWRLSEADEMYAMRNLILYGSEDVEYSDYLELLDYIGYN